MIATENKGPVHGVIDDGKPWTELSESAQAAMMAGYPGLQRLFAWARKYSAEADALFAATRNLGFSKAVQYVKGHPPSPECVLFMAYAGHRAMQGEQVRKGANVANANQVAAREWVREQWTKHRQEWRSKADFARGHMQDIRDQFDAGATEKTIVDRWLKGL